MAEREEGIICVLYAETDRDPFRSFLRNVENRRMPP